MNQKTIVTLNANQIISAGEMSEMDAQVLRDDDVSFHGGGFVAKETGDYRITAIQRIGEYTGPGKAQLHLDNGTDKIVLGLAGNNSEVIQGSRVVRLIGGQKITPGFYISGSEDAEAIADPVKSEIVFERA